MKTQSCSLTILRRVLCCIFALLVAVSIPLNAFAANYTASNSDELYNSWTAANNNSDKSNTFYITDDIRMDSVLLTESGKTYIVSSSGNGDYELSHVSIKAPTAGGGTVMINTDVTGTDEAALTVLGAATVAVNGDVTTTSNTTASGNHVAVEAAYGASITINGDVHAAEAGVYANDANITVRGNVTLESEGDKYNNHVIDADVDGVVIVTGNVTTEELGVLAMRDSDVVIYGDLKQESSGKVDSNSNVISASDGGTVDVKGNVIADEGGIGTNEATVIVGKDFIYNADTDEASAISANNKSNVTVKGDLISATNGVEALLDSTLTVGGDLIADGRALFIDESTATVSGDITSSAESLVTNNSDVTVNGDFVLTSGEDESQSGDLYVLNNSTMYMSDSTLLEADSICVSGGSSLDAALVHTTFVSVGELEGNSKDTSEFKAYTTTDNSQISMLSAAGSSNTCITGDIETVFASQNAYVEILGTVDRVTRTDNARVITEIGHGKTESYLPGQTTDDYAVGGTTAHTIIDLCQGYTTNSTLQKQHQEMQSLLSDVSRDISDELNVGSAAWASLFDHENINMSSYLSSRYTGHEFYDNAYYNETSRENFQSAENLNTYLITKFKDNLAQSMVDLSSSNEQWTQIGGQEVELLAKIFAFTKNFEDASDIKLTTAEKDFLKDLAGNTGEISGPEMLSFLRKFGYYTDGGQVLAAQRLSRAYNQFGLFMEDAAFMAKLGKAGVTILDLLKYNMSDYTSHMIVLDEILANQELSPEMYAAAAELRATMEDKSLGSFEKIVNQIKKDSVSAIKNMIFSPLAVGQAIVDITGLITGGTKDAEDLQNGAALTIMAPQLLDAFEDAVLNVKNGDTSEEAVQMVYMSYTMVKRTISNMCDVMTNIGNRTQEQEYKLILQKLEAMELGQLVDLVN